MDKVIELWKTNVSGENSPTPQVRERFRILLKRELSDSEQLLRTFGDGSQGSTKA